jgi:hypothetical protein
MITLCYCFWSSGEVVHHGWNVQNHSHHDWEVKRERERGRGPIVLFKGVPSMT